MELPRSFNLNTRKNEQTGKTEITGKRDDGSSYTVRTVDAVTPQVVDDIAHADRERTNAYEFVDRIVKEKEQHDRDFEAQMTDDFFAGSEQVMRGAWHSESSVGYTRKYADHYDHWIASLGDSNESQA